MTVFGKSVRPLRKSRYNVLILVAWNRFRAVAIAAQEIGDRANGTGNTWITYFRRQKKYGRSDACLRSAKLIRMLNASRKVKHAIQFTTQSLQGEHMSKRKQVREIERTLARDRWKRWTISSSSGNGGMLCSG